MSSLGRPSLLAAAKAGELIWPYAEVLLVLVAAGAAVAVPGPGRWLAGRHGVDVALAALVAATGVGLPEGAWAALRPNRGRLALTLAVSAIVLPPLAWLSSRLVGATTLRHGILSLGVAPVEVASVAAVTVAGGDAALAGGLLVGSTLLSVVVAGPILALMAGGGGAHPEAVIVNLVVVVAMPLILGLALRRWLPRGWAHSRVLRAAPVALVTILVWLVASQVVVTSAYIAVLGAAAVFVVASTALGTGLKRGMAPPAGSAVVLTTSMRDFAIAAGIATASFGAASAGPLGIYGVLVIVWGMAVAAFLRRRGAARP
ncbi:MAG: arsenite transporter [Acidimicrobiaceae bacterium]|jgi:predicted Na+-dependent transporter|nr:arsenite transporter [Acidimicrobiaceae bacterium]